MKLVEMVAKQLNEARSKEEFDSIFNYHYPNNPEVGKRTLEGYGVDFHRFDIKEAQPIKKEKGKVNKDAILKMVIDEPLVEEDVD